MIINGKRASSFFCFYSIQSPEEKPVAHLYWKRKSMALIEMELWNPVRGFETLYQVSNEGRVMSLKCGRTKLMKTPPANGYPSVCLVKDKAKHSMRVHRLVAEAFLQPVLDKPEIDHIDRNRSNNRVVNLRYADRSDQSINRGAYSNTGHKNISQHLSTGWYHILIKRRGVIVLNTAHSSLEEAIFNRDAYLDTE